MNHFSHKLFVFELFLFKLFAMKDWPVMGFFD